MAGSRLRRPEQLPRTIHVRRGHGHQLLRCGLRRRLRPRPPAADDRPAAAVAEWPALDRRGVDLALIAPLYNAGADFVSERGQLPVPPLLRRALRPDVGPVAQVAGTHLEDFAVGEVIISPEEYDITAERIDAYANEYDPQPIHVDPAAAARGRFGGIIASGWHTLSVTMRLMVHSNIFAGAPVVGVGVDNLRYLKPVRPGDVLRARADVLEIRPSRSHADRGYLVLRVTTLRQDDQPVITQEWTVLVPRRSEAPS